VTIIWKTFAEGEKHAEYQRPRSVHQANAMDRARPGEIGPFSLLTYEDARDWADTIREVVVEQRMPPWYADPRYGKFANERRLSREETDLLLTWIRQGCPKGDDKDLPSPAQFPEGWQIGKPDAVFRMAEEYKVPATGVLPYKHFTVDPGFKEDRWVEAAEARPGNRAVVHHILVYILAPGKLLYENYRDRRAIFYLDQSAGRHTKVFSESAAWLQELRLRHFLLGQSDWSHRLSVQRLIVCRHSSVGQEVSPE
jgi:hypothetical protein